MKAGAEIPQSQVIRTNDELCRFLLPNSVNAQTLFGSNLSWEVGIVGAKSNRNPEAWIQTRIRQLIGEKAQQDAEKYHLGEADKKVQKELYAGFSQSMLYRDGQEFAVRIIKADKTE